MNKSMNVNKIVYLALVFGAINIGVAILFFPPQSLMLMIIPSCIIALLCWTGYKKQISGNDKFTP